MTKSGVAPGNDPWQAIEYRGTHYADLKIFRDGGQHRSCSPEQTFERMQAVARACGVTRVADISGLDRIGIPVTSVIRPNSLTLATAAGKGLTTAIANVSGLMEAIELYHAENYPLPRFESTYNSIATELKKIRREFLPLSRHSLFNPDWPEEWATGWDIVGQEPVAVPAAGVLLQGAADPVSLSLAGFRADSNGLASGNTFSESVCSALLELIERDAVTCAECAGEMVGYVPPSVELSDLPFPSVRELLAKISDADIGVSLFDCTTDTEVPVFKALIYDNKNDALGAASGCGAHLDTEVAMLRALTEAVQGRAVLIGGARDDISRSDIASIRHTDMDGFRASEKRRERRAATVRRESTDSFHGDVSVLVAKLAAIGLHQIIVFDLKMFDAAYSVVKVIIPGLEGYRPDGNYRAGPRAHAFAMRVDRGRCAMPAAFPHLPAGGA
jgi:ribosomal protein S12 methylthiotransferase accessory factor